MGRWLLAETLEFARYHGINHIRFEMEPGDEIARRVVAGLPVVERDTRLAGIDLHPHYDDGTV